ncbi:DUF4249 domain-containing protein [uncultured Allomuricauda sp.]|uniref:DUF4249 domain-containing protein n=1 Tax=Flagellimonas sp. W118 TaxID=3410791 RepID=UPI002614A810|nr:DUF4249 domain-containing protein [uncultured Allomuricauda sp.]
MTDDIFKYRCELALLAFLPFTGCIEPFETEFIEFEDAFVVDATITDEMKQQEINLTRTYRFQDDGPSGESDALISVVDGQGNSYAFQETDSGNYRSNVAFAATPDTDYQLLITSASGKRYSSSLMRLPSTNQIDSIYAQRITNDFGEDGMGIFVNTSNSSETTNFYRFEYEETYKVIAPRWIPKELEVVETTPPSVIIVPRSLEERVCYPSRMSNGLILTDTEDFESGRVSNFMVRFIDSDNYILSHRYSILVKQYTHTLEAYTFLETLNEFSTSESVFSETQPGFLEGNISSLEDSNEKVLGFFNVSAVDEKRIFFNYEDFFPGAALPPYINPCVESAPFNGLFDLIRWDLIKYIKDNEGEFTSDNSGPYVTVPQVCGDCTILGPSEVPDFWTE